MESADVKGLLLDVYGTIVEEDDAVVHEICSVVADSVGASPTDVVARWGALFWAALDASHGADFRSQREICETTLASTIAEFGADADAGELSERQFAGWRSLPLRPASREFLEQAAVPICLVSNIDRADLEALLDHHGIRVDAVVTSEDVRAYKPRPEPFHRALEALGLAPSEVLHVGDSVRGDVAGAAALGIPMAWINRLGRPRPRDAAIRHEVRDLGGLFTLLPGVTLG